MARRKKGKTCGFFVGTVFGALVGGVTALFCAPKSGKKLRKDISKKCHEVSDKTQEIVSNVTDQCSDLCEKAKEYAEDAKDAARSLIKEVRKRK